MWANHTLWYGVMYVVNKEYDVVIIGAGPAGLSAAIYTARGGQKTLVLSNPREGAIQKIDKLDNYLGFPGGITGPELMERAKKQGERFEAEFLEEEALIIKINSTGDGYIIETVNNEIETRGIILSTGVKHAKPNIENLASFEGMGVSYCVVCDGFFFREKKVGVVGSKDYAGKEALELLNYTKNITIFTNGKPLEIQDSLMEKIKENRITINQEKCQEVVGTKNNTVGGLKLKNGKTVELDGIFIAVGTSGATDFAKTLGIQTEGNTIKVDGKYSTGVPNIYACGDCTGGNRQVATAVGQGADAAINLISEIKGTKHIDYH